MTFPDSYDVYRPTVRSGLHTEAVSGFSWAMQGQRGLMRQSLGRLSFEELLEADLAACVYLNAITEVTREKTLPRRINTPCAVCGRAGCAERFHPAWLDGAPA